MLRNFMNATLTVYRGAFAADGRGGRSKTMGEVGTVRARVSQPSAQERFVAGQMDAKLTHVVHVEYGADVQRGDELDAGDARRMRVMAVMNDSSRTYRRLECELVQGV
jgi:SPP1 family predicted phage head-tail adaptor